MKIKHLLPSLFITALLFSTCFVKNALAFGTPNVNIYNVYQDPSYPYYWQFDDDPAGFVDYNRTDNIAFNLQDSNGGTIYNGSIYASCLLEGHCEFFTTWSGFLTPQVQILFERYGESHPVEHYSQLLNTPFAFPPAHPVIAQIPDSVNSLGYPFNYSGSFDSSEDPSATSWTATVSFI